MNSFSPYISSYQQPSMIPNMNMNTVPHAYPFPNVNMNMNSDMNMNSSISSSSPSSLSYVPRNAYRICLYVYNEVAHMKGLRLLKIGELDLKTTILIWNFINDHYIFDADFNQRITIEDLKQLKLFIFHKQIMPASTIADDIDHDNIIIHTNTMTDSTHTLQNEHNHNKMLVSSTTTEQRIQCIEENVNELHNIVKQTQQQLQSFIKNCQNCHSTTEQHISVTTSTPSKRVLRSRTRT